MKRKVIVLLVLVAIFLSGCGSLKGKEEKKINLETIQKTSFPGSYQYQGERVKVDIENIEPREAYFINGTSTPMELDCIKIGRMFMPDDGTNEIDMELKCIMSKEMVGDEYKEIFLWGENAFEYISGKTSKLVPSLSESKNQWNFNLPMYTEKKEFSFGSDREALDDIIRFLDKAGIHLGENYKVYTYYLDYETLKEQETYFDMDGNKLEVGNKWEWSEADNAYLFYIHQSYCGLEDYQCGRRWKPAAERENAQIRVIYNADGIAEIRVRDLNSYSMGSSQETLLDFETVAQNVISHFEYILGNNTYEITSAQLICDIQTLDSNKDNEIVPVWEFQITENTEGGIQMHYEQRFNAVTGEKMEH